MATKKGSKTAHVLNVLSSQKQSLENDQDAGETRVIQQQAEPSRPLRIPILEVAHANDDALLAEQIRELLEEEMLQGEEMTAEGAETISSEPMIESIPDAGIEVEPEERQNELFSTAQKVEAKVETAEPTSKPVESNSNDRLGCDPLPDDYCYMNIMQALVEEKCMKYIEMFGLCTCSRCVADVKALALSNLPPKYSVMHKGEISPMLGVLEGRFNSALTAQILNACKVVMEHPRHTV
jgi:hypothetical protein